MYKFGLWVMMIWKGFFKIGIDPSKEPESQNFIGVSHIYDQLGLRALHLFSVI